MRLPVKRIHQGPATNAHLLVCKQQLFTVLYQLSHTLLPLHRPLFFLWSVLHSSYQCRDVFCHRVPKHYIYKAKKFRLKHRTNVRSITGENTYGLFRSFFFSFGVCEGLTQCCNSRFVLMNIKNQDNFQSTNASKKAYFGSKAVQIMLFIVFGHFRDIIADIMLKRSDGTLTVHSSNLVQVKLFQVPCP